jgi:hypothetical protein
MTLTAARSVKFSHEANVNQKPTTEPPNNQKRIIQTPVMTKMIAKSPGMINIITNTPLAFPEQSHFISRNFEETIHPTQNPPKVKGIPKGSPGINVAH